MNLIALALAQINPTVGAAGKNAELILDWSVAAVKKGASIIVFPELAISGYPPEDLVYKKHFLDECWRRAQWLCGKLPPEALVLFGIPVRSNGHIFNAAMAVHGGHIMAVYHKMMLPNYGVFDEKRVFAPGRTPMILQAGPLRIGLHICEDSWYEDQDPVYLLRDARIQLLVNLSASPYHRGKSALRESVLRQTRAQLNVSMAYCNLVGGQDELVFDGGSMILDAQGEIVARARQFEEELTLASIPFNGEFLPLADAPQALQRMVHIPFHFPTKAPNPSCFSGVEPMMDDCAEVYAALKTGLRDYVEKNGFKKVVLGLSGGIDSALVAAIAVDTLGSERVAGVTMPSPYTSGETHADAALLAQNLGIEFHDVSIRAIYEMYLKELQILWPDKPADTTEENLQARIRGTIIMALSNKFGWLVLTTGNKSELATGYCTLYGDMAGGFSLIKDVPKTLVYDLARWRNKQSDRPIIPKDTITRPPTAELRADQKDTDSLPPYEILDPIIERYVERDMGLEEIVKDGFEASLVERVGRMIDLNEYKRRQGAPGIKITPKAFGRDRRMPLTNAFRERVESGGL